MDKVKKAPGFELPNVYLNPFQTWEIKNESDLMGITLREIMEPVTAILEQICRMLIKEKCLRPGAYIKHFSQDNSHSKNRITDLSRDLV